VLHQRLGVPVLSGDVYALAVGGVQVVEPAADLPKALAVLSAVSGRPVDPRVVACGEVALAGEVRSVPHLPRRLSEAQRLGFRRAVVPLAGPASVPGLDVIRVRSVAEAAWACGVLPDAPGQRVRPSAGRAA
jgi:DNA repair protein RadA/Sms